MLKGSCVCGGVRFTLGEKPLDAGACHCVQCRKQSGHYWASSGVPKGALEVEGRENVTWYHASAKVRRGFCSRCGSWLFWEPVEGDRVEVALGAIDGPTGLRLQRHIFVSEKGDYYDIADGLPQRPR